MEARKNLILLALVTAAVSSCSFFDSTIVVQNNDFEVGAKAVWDSELLQWGVGISLAKGMEDDYQFSYHFEDYALCLRDESGRQVTSGGNIHLSKGIGMYYLPEVGISTDETLHLCFSRKGVEKRYSLPISINSGNAVLEMSVDVKSSGSNTLIHLKNAPGITNGVLNIKILMDGEFLEGVTCLNSPISEEGVDLEFTSSGKTFVLPYIVPGTHSVTVEYTSSKSRGSITHVFTEPLRKRTALAFSYNSFTGNLMLASEYNPLETSFEVTTDITVKGSVTYRHKQFFGVADPITEYFTETCETSVVITPSLSSVSIDSGKLKETMDKVFANTRTDAANGIGNGNAHDVHASINSVDLKFTVHSLGQKAGQTPVSITPLSSSSFAISYTYSSDTYYQSKGYVRMIYPSFSINGKTPASVEVL